MSNKFRIRNPDVGRRIFTVLVNMTITDCLSAPVFDLRFHSIVIYLIKPIVQVSLVTFISHIRKGIKLRRNILKHYDLNLYSLCHLSCYYESIIQYNQYSSLGATIERTQYIDNQRITLVASLKPGKNISSST